MRCRRIGSFCISLPVCSIAPPDRSAALMFLLRSATPLVDSSSPYNYSQAQAIFHQPALSALLLQRFAAANKASFKAIKTSQSWTFGERTVKAGEALSALLAAAKDERLAVPVFDALMDELAAQTT